MSFDRRYTFLICCRLTCSLQSVFSLGGQPSRAVEAYQKANAWPELFTILLSEKRPAADIKALAIEVAGPSPICWSSAACLTFICFQRASGRKVALLRREEWCSTTVGISTLPYRCSSKAPHSRRQFAS